MNKDSDSAEILPNSSNANISITEEKVTAQNCEKVFLTIYGS